MMQVLRGPPPEQVGWVMTSRAAILSSAIGFTSFDVGSYSNVVRMTRWPVRSLARTAVTPILGTPT